MISKLPSGKSSADSLVSNGSMWSASLSVGTMTENWMEPAGRKLEGWSDAGGNERKDKKLDASGDLGKELT
jgi:hypothetical protein